MKIYRVVLSGSASPNRWVILNMQSSQDRLKMTIPPKSCDFIAHLDNKPWMLLSSYMRVYKPVAQVLSISPACSWTSPSYCVDEKLYNALMLESLVVFEARLGFRVKFRNVEREVDPNVPSMTRLPSSARTPWTMGNENFPSVRSSAKPLFFWVLSPI